MLFTKSHSVSIFCIICKQIQYKTRFLCITMNLSDIFTSNIKILINHSKCVTSKPFFYINKNWSQIESQVPLKGTHVTLKFSRVVWRHFHKNFIKWNIDWTNDYSHITNKYLYKNDKIKLNKLSEQLQMKESNFLRFLQKISHLLFSEVIIHVFI